MYRIQTKGYDAKEKSIIANDYIVPSIREQVKFADGDVTIPNDVINHIVDKYTDKEDGVRNLKRCLEIIHTKLNLYRLMKPGTNLFEKDMKIDVAFPVTVTKEMVDKLIKQDQDTGSWRNMYM
jgi:ATP-dependent Lon protease|tara:strand:+ start:104 stop:472 length:369 start_codon:yes stop_codon:yes gene_type:complete